MNRIKQMAVKTFLRNSGPRFRVATASFIILTLLVSIILPAIKVKAEETLTWTTNADFSMNKPGPCGATTLDGVAISGVAYSDENCEVADEDTSLSLGPDSSSLQSVVQVSAGSTHSLALKDDGTVWSWGNNSFGQLGDGSVVNQLIPTQVVGSGGAGYLEGVTSVSAGPDHSCAVASGQAYCWGEGALGRLGSGSFEDSLYPVPVVTSTMSGTVTAISAGNIHTCAVASGQAYCWGAGNNGRLGQGSTSSTSNHSPLAVVTSTMSGTVTSISAGGSHSCAVASGQAYCWGLGNNGQIGAEAAVSSNGSPLAVSTSTMSGTVTSVSTGSVHSCAIASGGVYCWGLNGNGQLGDNSTTQRTTPVAVNNSTMSGTVSAIATGGAYSCAIATGQAYCWGLNSNGQLGDNSTTQRTTPVAVNTSTMSGTVTSISAGSTHTCAITSSQAYCWGGNDYGQAGMYNFGGNTLLPADIYAAVNSISFNPNSIVTGGNNSCAIASGQAYCWGNGFNGQLGINSTESQSYPVAVDTSLMSGTVTAMATGTSHSCAIATGQAYCWGLNGSGRLGDNSATQRNTPVAVDTSLMSGTVTAISAGFSHTCAVASGQAYCWGSGSSGQLGNGSTTASQTTPVAVDTSLMSGTVTAITVGTSHSCAIASGQAYCWGVGSSGELGNGSTTASQTTPVAVDTSLMSGTVTAISAGSNHTCAIASGQAYCWGHGNSGRLGNGATTQQLSPAAVVSTTMSGTVTAISAGASHSCAVASGQAYCWGLGSNGRVGHNATTTTNSSPQVVVASTMSGTVTAISAGASHSCAVASGQAYCWGLGSSGQLGAYFTGSSISRPLQVISSISFEGGFQGDGTASGFIVDFGLGRKTQWLTIDWQTEALPAGTSVSFAARTSNDNETWSEWSDDFVQSVAGSTSGLGDLEGLPVTRFIELRSELSTSDSSMSPTLNSFSLSYMDDSQVPTQNASDIVMQRSQEGAVIQNEGWINVQTPYISWQPGQDDINGSGLLGYCLYLGQDETADLTQTAGLLGSSPAESGGACQYVVDTTVLDLAQPGVLGNSLEDNGLPYYLIIKAIDNSGNIYDGVAEQFTFNFDATPPTNPAFISAPSQFVATKNVTLTWPTSGGEAPSDARSGVAGLQYKIGSGGSWHGAGHTGSGDVSDVLPNNGSYQTSEEFDYPLLIEGNNLVYFRTIDNAGNISSSNVIAVIRINTSSPTQPQNLSVTPSTNTTNSFAFSWQAPATFIGPVGAITYCYTINTLPSSSTCNYTQPGTTSLSADAFATQPGENTVYVVAKDEAGNVNYATYATVEFTANTPAPGIPGNFEMADVSTKDAQIWKLALSWEEPESAGAGVARYSISRSTNGTTYSELATTAGLSYVDGALSQQTYYYKVRACDSANNCGAFSEPMSKIPTGRYTSAPDIIGNPSVEVSTRTATFTWTTDRESDSRIQYGIESGVYFTGEVAVSSSSQTHSVDIQNLEAGTTYFYKAKWTDEDGNTGISGELSFTTLPAPVVKDVEVIKKTLTGALIKFTSTDATKVNLTYGKTEGFGGLSSVNTSISESSYIVELAGLDDGTTYFYKLSTFDSDGNEYDSYRIDSFATPPRPRISNLRFQPVEGEPTSTQRVTWTTNVLSNSTVTYGKLNTNGIDSYTSKMTREHEIVLRGLEDDSTYFLLAQSRDADGNLAVGDRQVFKTALDTRPPKISDIRISTAIKGNGSEARGQIVVSWKTDEPATSQVGYAFGAAGSEYPNKTSEDSQLTTEHVVIVSDLSVSNVYHLVPISRDRAFNSTVGQDQSAVIGRATESILNIILNSLKGIFGI